MAGDYEIRERVVTVEAVLDERQFECVHKLMRRRASAQLPERAGYVFDLPSDRRGDAVLRFLRDEDVAHVLSEERVWPAH